MSPGNLTDEGSQHLQANASVLRFVEYQNLPDILHLRLSKDGAILL